MKNKSGSHRPIHGKNFSRYIRSHIACQEEECVCNACASPILRRGMWLMSGSIISFGSAATISVRVMPGATAFTRIWKEPMFPCQGPGQTVDRIFTGWIGNAARLAADADH